MIIIIPNKAGVLESPGIFYNQENGAVCLFLFRLYFYWFLKIRTTRLNDSGGRWWQVMPPPRSTPLDPTRQTILTEDSDEKQCFSYPGTTPTMFSAASCPNLKTSVITFVNAHTIWYYLQMAVLLSNKTLSVECYSETSINCVLCTIAILSPLSTAL